MFFVYLAAELFLLGAEIASEWPQVRRELERGETPQDQPPLASQIRATLRGLSVHAEEPARADRAPNVTQLDRRLGASLRATKNLPDTRRALPARSTATRRVW
jgi:hypothetical protein